MRFVVPLIVVAAAGLATLVGIVVFQASTRPRVADRDPTVRLLSTGQRVDLVQHIKSRGWTLIEFMGAFAPECRKVGKRLDAVVQRRPDLRVRVIDIGSYESDVAQQYEIESVPTLWLYRDGQLVATEADAVWQQLEAAQ